MRYDVIADIVGVLADMAVDEGEQVREGQMIGQMESMKIMFPLYAPCAGRVYFVAELGELIGEGGVVAQVEDGV